jgi:chloride channel 3/4/5
MASPKFRPERSRGEEVDEATPLVDATSLHGVGYGHIPRRRSVGTASSIRSSRISLDELALADTAIGERLPYNAYQTIDWLHDLVCSRRPSTDGP